MVKLSPSILSANFSKLGEEVKELDKNGVEMIHIDVMDGMFVPNISFGMPIIKSIRSLTNLIFDVHLMIEKPSRYIDDFIASGADIITIHYESEIHIDRTINYIKSKGVKVGIALNPSTPVSVLENIIGLVDMVLIMSVNPGFGGQKFINYAVDKISKVHEMSKNINSDLMIQIDGGVDKTNLKTVIDAGANVIVAGSALFKNNDIANNVKEFRDIINN